MSIDVRVWATERFDLPAQLPEPQNWHTYDTPIPKVGNVTNYAYESDGWQVLVTFGVMRKPTPPDSIRSLDMIEAYIVNVSLEPIGADKSGYAMLERTVRDLARATNGRWIDPVNGTLHDADAGSFN
ncbi:MAG: hypothetical protein AAFX06_20680 [Planctomycetota bacterium]